VETLHNQFFELSKALLVVCVTEGPSPGYHPRQQGPLEGKRAQAGHCGHSEIEQRLNPFLSDFVQY
jgi:hypothetical protein